MSEALIDRAIAKLQTLPEQEREAMAEMVLESHRTFVDSLLKDLDKARKLIGGVVRRSHRLEGDLDVSRLRTYAAKALTYIHELDSELYDLNPDLTPLFLRPSLAPINFTPALERLQSNDWAIRESTIRSFQYNMSDRDASLFSEAIESGTELEFARQWWEQQQKPFIPVTYVYKFLRHERKHMRYHSAKVLEEIFEVDLWNDRKDDVAIECADRWFRTWQNSVRRPI